MAYIMTLRRFTSYILTFQWIQLTRLFRDNHSCTTVLSLETLIFRPISKVYLTENRGNNVSSDGGLLWLVSYIGPEAMQYKIVYCTVYTAFEGFDCPRLSALLRLTGCPLLPSLLRYLPSLMNGVFAGV
jgi:hypothetical protein